MAKGKTTEVVLAVYLPDHEIDHLIEPICTLADMDTANEDPQRADDPDMDALILAARRIRDREGFLVSTVEL